MLSPHGLSDCKSFVAQHHAAVRALSLGESGARYIDQCASPWRQSVRSGDNLRPWFRLRCGRVNICCGDQTPQAEGNIAMCAVSWDKISSFKTWRIRWLLYVCTLDKFKWPEQRNEKWPIWGIQRLRALSVWSSGALLQEQAAKVSWIQIPAQL